MVADAGGSSAIGRDHPGPEVAGHVARETKCPRFALAHSVVGWNDCELGSSCSPRPEAEMNRANFTKRVSADNARVSMCGPLKLDKLDLSSSNCGQSVSALPLALHGATRPQGGIHEEIVER